MGIQKDIGGASASMTVHVVLLATSEGTILIVVNMGTHSY